MQRLYMHVHNGFGTVCDEEGLEFADMDAAIRCAIANIRSIMCEEAREGCVDLRGRLDIAVAGGQVLRTIRFDEAVTVIRDDDNR